MFRKMPFILVIIIAFIVIFGHIIPLSLKQVLYSISLTTKSIIIFILPLIIFSLLFKTLVMLSNNATRVILIIIILVCCSNFISTFLSNEIGIWIYGFDLSMIEPKDSNNLTALWSFNLPKLINNDKAMFMGVILGIISSKISVNKSKIIALQLEKITNILLSGFIYFIPLFVTGFVVKLEYDGAFMVIMKDYSVIFVVIAIVQFSYIIIIYLLLNNFIIKNALKDIKNMIPAAITGFCTMSSAASIPLTIIGVENNAKNKDIARSVIPITVNIHLIGDCFAIPIFSYAVLKSFGIESPSLVNYLTFTLYFVLAKFSVAAIPGGGIIVMLPILEKYLGFNGEMMSLITALYVLFDPVITCANVLGNGAFAKLIDRITNR